MLRSTKQSERWVSADRCGGTMAPPILIGIWRELDPMHNGTHNYRNPDFTGRCAPTAHR
jgi:hypothetical protein